MVVAPVLTTVAAGSAAVVTGEHTSFTAASSQAEKVVGTLVSLGVDSTGVEDAVTADSMFAR